MVYEVTVYTPEDSQDKYACWSRENDGDDQFENKNDCDNSEETAGWGHGLATYNMGCGRDCRSTKGKRDYWLHGTGGCGVQRNGSACMRPMKRTCTKYFGEAGYVKNSASWQRDNDTRGGKVSPVECKYNLDEIEINNDEQTKQNIINWKDKTPNNEAYNYLMSKFCSMTSYKCPNDPRDNKPVAKCSLINSNDNKGCAVWYNNAANNYKDSVIASYCSVPDNISNYDCACYNRGLNREYVAIAKTKAFKDGCWYIPCKDSHFLIPSKDVVNPGDCPQNVCDQVYNTVIGDLKGDINYSDLINNISCNLAPPPSPPPIDPTVNPQNPNVPIKPKEPTNPVEPVIPSPVNPQQPQQPQTSKVGFFESLSTTTIIVIGCVIIIPCFLLLIYVIFRMFRK